MAYAKQTWIDGMAGGTPVSAARLNHLETGIEAAIPSTGIGSAEHIRFKNDPWVDISHDAFGARLEKTAAENDVAIAAALSWSVSNGLPPVVVPRGIFNTEGGHALVNDQYVHGFGYDATGSVLRNLTATPTLNMSAASRSRVSDLRLLGNPSAPVAGSKGIECIGVGVGPARCSLTNVYSQYHDIGFDLDNTYIWTILNCAGLFNTTAGMRLGALQTNDIRVLGGEYVGNGKGIIISGMNKVALYTCIEGNVTHGVHVLPGANVNALSIESYFENNGTVDVELNGTVNGWRIVGCFMGVTPRNVLISGSVKGGICQGNDMIPGINAGAAIRTLEITNALATNNVYGPNYELRNGFDPKLHDAGSKLVEISPIRQTLRGTATLDFPSIPANSSADLTITVTGAAVGDDVICNPNSLGALPTGVTWSAVVSAANTVTVRMLNGTTAAVDPVAASWRARVFRAP